MEKEKNLLSHVQLIVENEKEKSKLKGEDFNIFLITKKTSNEQFTHSAFIAELLNPKGSHHLGDVFLKEFIKIINKRVNESIGESSETNKKIEEIFKEYNSDDLYKTKVYKEKRIGEVKRFKLDSEGKKSETELECGEAEGGFIDILLELNGFNISIENKVYAEFQPRQIERYANENKEKNIVFLLTLLGDDTDEKCVTINKDYFCISYYKEIDEWLKKCYSFSKEYPILRESIKQYQLLIQKLSGKMKYSKKLQKIILNNIDAADNLNKNFNGALNKIKDDFRNSVFKALDDKLFSEKLILKLEKWGKIEDRKTRVFIKNAKENDAKVYFGIESFSGNELFFGIYVLGGGGKIADEIRKIAKETKKAQAICSNDNWWPIKEYVFTGPPQDKAKLNLGDTAKLKKLHTDEVYKENVINEITENVIAFIEKYKSEVYKVNNENTR
jgi:hypothetical protein